MNIKRKGAPSVSWDEFFEQATEDISTYLWAAQSWSNPPEGYSPGYLLILAFSNRARGRCALRIMDIELPPQEFAPYGERLKGMWSTAEKSLADGILATSDNLGEIIAGELMLRLDQVESDLRQVRNIAQDGDLMDDPDWVAEDLRDAAYDFLLRFNDLALVQEELKGLSMPISDNYRNFENKFVEVEQCFRNYFGYFHGVEDTFLKLRSREYYINRWWLTTPPKADVVQEEDIPKTVMKRMQDAFQSSGQVAHESCPDPEIVIAYAMNELEAKKIRNVADHLLKCRSCLNLVLDLRLSDAESHGQREKIEDGLLKIQAVAILIVLSAISHWQAIRRRPRLGDGEEGTYNIPGLVWASGFRKKHTVVLLEDSEDNPPELQEVVGDIRIGRRFYQILMQEPDGHWISKGEPEKVKLPITIEDPSHDRFVLLLEQTKKDLEYSTGIALDALNQPKGVSTGKVYESTVMIVIKVVNK